MGFFGGVFEKRKPILGKHTPASLVRERIQERAIGSRKTADPRNGNQRLKNCRSSHFAAPIHDSAPSGGIDR